MEAIATSLSSHGGTSSELSGVVEGYFNFYKNETDFVLYRVDTGNVTVRGDEDMSLIICGLVVEAVVHRNSL